MKFSTAKTILLLLAALPSLLFAQGLKEKAIKHSDSISIEEFYSYMNIFAHDSLEGRGVASEGFNKSAEYIANKLKEFDIEPAGDNGSYYQSVPIVRTIVTPESSTITFNSPNIKIDLIYGENISLLSSTSQEEVSMSRKLVFAGDGIVIKEQGVNPYQGIDVKDKIVILQLSMPKRYRGDSTAKANSQIDKRIEAAIAEGAIGIIFYFPMKMLEKFIFKAIHKESVKNLYSLNAENTQKLFYDFDLEFMAMIQMKQLKEIFRQNNQSLKKVKKAVKKGQQISFEIEGELSVNYEATHEDKTCKNIVGIIKGSDPDLKNEYIVMSAHLDHLGIDKAIKGDSIYNGAWDNASGSSGILTLAHSFSQMPEKPKRSILFIWCTGEEKGLLGSNYFVTNPTVEKDKIKACVNLDMVGSLFDAKDFITMGYDLSTMSEAVDFAGETVGMVHDTANNVQNRYFTASDHFSFVKEGIPGIFLWGGFTPVGEDKKNEKIYKKWEKEHLHKPDDDMNQEFCDEAFLKGLKLNFLTTWYLANEMDEITWKTDNKYYKKYVLKECE